MTEKLGSVSSTSTSGRLSGIHRPSRSSQMDCPITNERLPMLHSKSPSVCSSGPLSINSDPQDSTDLMLDDESENGTYVNDPGNCGKDCLVYSSVCRGFGYKRMFCDRFPKGRAVFIVFLINTLESFAIFGAFDGLKERIIGHSDRMHLAYLFLFFQWCGGRIFYPIAGLIADTWLGRYRMIKIGLWLMWLGFVIIAVNESLVYHYTSNSHYNHTAEQYVLPITAVVLLIISSATVEANIIPFGVDQIQQGASSSEMSSYFYYYYFSRIAGLLIGLVLFLLLFSTGIKLYPDFTPWSENYLTPHTLHTIHPLFAVLSVTVALILHFCTSQHYFKDKDYSNPLRLIINVLYYAATVKRQPPRYRRAFRYGEERKSRIELAKMEYDGIFTSEEVEDVKTFLRICLVIFSLSGNFLTFGMSWNILQDGLSAASKSVPVLKSDLLSPEIFTLFFHLVSLISILMMNHLIIPPFPGFRMKLKIGAGVVFSALAPATALIIQLITTKEDFSCSEGFSCHHPTQLLWLIFPVIFAAIGLMHIFTAGLEFIYAQSPNSMKGLLTGFFYLWYGIFNGAGIIFYGNFVANHDHKTRREVIYSAVATCVGVASVILYMVVACIYKNRVRPMGRDDIEDDAVRRGMYGNVSTLNFPDRGN